MKMDVYSIDSPHFSVPIAEVFVLNRAAFQSATKHNDAPGSGFALGEVACTVGFFDGVHRGHQYVLQTLRTAAQQRALPTVAVTFAQHPRSLVSQTTPPPALTTLGEKIERMGACHIDAVAVLNFTPEMAQLSAQEFMAQVLREGLGARFLLMGYDHRFGRPKADEGFADYVRYGADLGIEVALCDKAETALQLSSSSIRLLLEQGNVAEANLLLGRFYKVSGVVVHGFQNGRKLGFPTANLQLDASKLVPHLGSYATWVTWKGQRYVGMTNIGRRPTLDNGEEISLETHLLDFKGNLYDETLTLEFVARLRDEKRFEGLKHLKAQLEQDAAKTREVLGCSSQ